MRRAGINMHDTAGPRHGHILVLFPGPANGYRFGLKPAVGVSAGRHANLAACAYAVVQQGAAGAQVHEDNYAWIGLKEMKRIRAADI